jgi:hypothetical protein
MKRPEGKATAFDGRSATRAQGPKKAARAPRATTHNQKTERSSGARSGGRRQGFPPRAGLLGPPALDRPASNPGRFTPGRGLLIRLSAAEFPDQIECKFFINSYGNRPTTQGIIAISRNDSGGRARGGNRSECKTPLVLDLFPEDGSDSAGSPSAYLGGTGGGGIGAEFP